MVAQLLTGMHSKGRPRHVAYHADKSQACHGKRRKARHGMAKGGRFTVFPIFRRRHANGPLRLIRQATFGERALGKLACSHYYLKLLAASVRPLFPFFLFLVFYLADFPVDRVSLVHPACRIGVGVVLPSLDTMHGLVGFN